MIRWVPPLAVQAFSEDASLPPPLQSVLHELKDWALGNKRDASRAVIAFWAFKTPAILVSASAGVWAHFGLTSVSVIAGAIASICVIIDGIHPRGMLRNTYLRAYHDLSILSSKMLYQWRTRTESSSEADAIRTILKTAQAERDRIAAYLRDAEIALKAEVAVLK